MVGLFLAFESPDKTSNQGIQINYDGQLSGGGARVTSELVRPTWTEEKLFEHLSVEAQRQWNEFGVG
jgi:hypothetical protein